MEQGVASFDYYIWQFRFPELAVWVPQGLASSFFDEATLYLNNTPHSLIRDVKQRAIILGQITAHIAALRAPLKNQESSPLVGRISTASEGSVSVGVDLAGLPGTAVWFAQTKYGLMAWQAMAQFRGARYIPGPRPNYNGVLPW